MNPTSFSQGQKIIFRRSTINDLNYLLALNVNLQKKNCVEQAPFWNYDILCHDTFFYEQFFVRLASIFFNYLVQLKHSRHKNNFTHIENSTLIFIVVMATPRRPCVGEGQGNALNVELPRLTNC